MLHSLSELLEQPLDAAQLALACRGDLVPAADHLVEDGVRCAAVGVSVIVGGREERVGHGQVERGGVGEFEVKGEENF